MIRGQSLPAIQRGKDRFRLEHIAGRTVLYVVITVGAFIFSMPLLWMISTSLKSPELINRIPIIWIPPEFRWANYIDPWREMPFLLFYRNTIFITVTNTVIILITNSLVAFGFARIPFKGRTIIFFVLSGHHDAAAAGDDDTDLSVLEPSAAREYVLADHGAGMVVGGL